ncbi:hypothetical protein QQ045_018116 [Rhodiola kirilowii]
MAGDGASSGTRELDQTPTWAVASVCAGLIIISIVLEKGLHKIGHWLMAKHKKPLLEALEKVKSELMVLGFISLLLTFFQVYIVRICISSEVAKTMLPCANKSASEDSDESKKSGDGHRRRLLWHDHRFLSSEEKVNSCGEGYAPLVSANGLHQLHILLFFLAFFHVLYSAITMMLGRLKIRGWKQWEKETLSDDYEFSNDPARFRLTHETSFVRAHISFWTRIPFFFYVRCFFRQFYRSVGRADYLALRNGFISVHLAPGSKFDFQKYIKRSLEDDFKTVVGISPVLWVSFVLYLLINVSGWHVLFWASLFPIIIILAVGTKLQAVLTKMAIEIAERHAVVQGIPLVQASDKYFWFGKPQLVLHLIHCALFQNAFQLTYFLWIWYSFGKNSCFQDDLKITIIKLAIGVATLFLCSYSTLPLYALVTQMGSTMKKSVFDEQTSKALKNWHMAVKKKKHGRTGRSRSPTPLLSASPMTSPSSSHSTGPELHRYKTTGHSIRRSSDDRDLSDMELDNLIVKNIPGDEHQIELSETHPANEIMHVDDSSFSKPVPGKRSASFK